MRALTLVPLTFVLVSAVAVAADDWSMGAPGQWTLGAAAGGGWYHQASVTKDSGDAQAGFAPQFAAGVVVGDDAYRYFGGEARYIYRAGDVQLQSQGQSATMSADAHILDYEMLAHATPRSSRIRPFVAGGGGAKIYRETGKEQAFQPLSNFAFLTKTHQIEPEISYGGGVKCRISRHAQFRVDFRDFVTPFPDKIIVPAPGAKHQGWLHDFVPMAGFSYVF